MKPTRNVLVAFVVIVTLATVACQPVDPAEEERMQAPHRVIEVPPSPTLLPNATVPMTRPPSAATSAPPAFTI